MEEKPTKKERKEKGMGNFNKYVERLDAALRPQASFDVIRREFKPKCAPKAVFYYIDGFVKDQVTEKLFEFLLSAERVEDITENMPYVEFESTRDLDRLVTMVLSGAAAFVLDGVEEAFILDVREYPVRSISEPENDRVLRGPHDGFTETLLFNTAMIRRRIRDPMLTMQVQNIGTSTRTDVVLCYVKGRADDQFVKKLENRLKNLDVGALNCTQQNLTEMLIPRQWYNPFPKIRFTERPDSAAAMLLEGSVLLLCDNTPAVMILPTSIFDYLQSSDDFYFSPLVGSYLRLVRLIVSLATLFLTPTWYLLQCNQNWVPVWLGFTVITEDVTVPILCQLLLVEIAVDGLKLASLNTPDALTNSLSVVGGLILGDFAIQVGWLRPEVIFYMAFVALANFTQPSYELGYALKFCRVWILLLTALFDFFGVAFIGYILGIVSVILLIVTNRSVEGGRGYLYPLIPWNGRAMKRLFFRVQFR